jgi:uncharacterized protein (DUF427 family)
MLGSNRGTPPGPGQESVWDYPRPPRLEDSGRHIQIEVGGLMLVDTRRAKRVLETSHPPTYYIPPEDVRMDLLRPISGTTWCEWKGAASYFDVVLDGRVISRAAWSYAQPVTAYAALAGYLAFYPSKMDRCTVDGEVVQAQAGDFYGGWITADIVGPFKGGMGTLGW